TILRSELVTLDGSPATLHIGDRYPVIVNGYYGQTNGTGQTYTPPPTVNFQDLGLVLKVTPSVHIGDEISLDIDAENNVLGLVSSNDIPVISRRKYAGKIRLAEGEEAVVAGLVNTAVTVNRSGIPLLHKIPWIGRFFQDNTRGRQDDEVLLVL